VRVRVLDAGVPARVMEDEVTRQLEEQLAITEGVVAIQSRSSEGRSAVDLSFRYGEDVDQALRDASSRLDRAKRFLPESIDPPIIYKRDPFQLPVAEYVVSSQLLDPVELRGWVDYGLSRSLLTLPGVAAAEVGGGLEREVRIIADQYRLAGLGLDVLDLEATLREANRDLPAGRLLMPQGEISGRTGGRFESVQQIVELPLPAEGRDDPLSLLRLGEIARSSTAPPRNGCAFAWTTSPGSSSRSKNNRWPTPYPWWRPWTTNWRAWPTRGRSRTTSASARSTTRPATSVTRSATPSARRWAARCWPCSWCIYSSAASAAR
jgi:multidrug efflux pump subunit AcrB